MAIEGLLVFLPLYLVAMTLPGALLANLLSVRENRAGVAVSLSICLLVFTFVVSRTIGIGAAGLGWLLGLLYASLVVVAVVAGKGFNFAGFARNCRDKTTLIPVLTFACIVGYSVWAGPYTEIPADAWYHIGEIQDRFERATSGRIGSFESLGQAFEKYAGYSYSITGVLLAVAKLPPMAALSYISFANTLLFCVGVYAFSLFVFKGMVESRITRHWIAAAAVFFFISQFGISVFSYVRYYVFSPAILNYVIYLSALSCVMAFIEKNDGRYNYLLVAGVFTVVAAMMHLQEAIFIVIMSGVIVLAECLRRPFWRRTDSAGKDVASSMRVWVLSGLLVLAYLAVHLWSLANLEHNEATARRMLTDIEHVVPFLKEMPILKPGYQFYQIVAVWGTLVYVLFLWRIREFKGSTFLLMGMAVPLLTVFNPVFTDLFLRFSWPELLWRMCLMLPLPFVGGYLLVSYARCGFKSNPISRRLGAFSMVLLLLLLLLPLQGTYFYSPYSKVYTVKPVAEENSHKLWQDALQFLYRRNSTEVVTDPVTGYVVRALTEHKVVGYKFYSRRSQLVSAKTFAADDLENGWLVVVNYRDGAFSDTGRVGRHWPGNVMGVSSHYSPEFISYIKDNPDLFNLIWRQNQISIYRVTFT